MADFLVVGNHAVDDVAPGGVVAIGDEARARYLTRAGHILAVPAKAKAADKPKTKDR